MNGSPPQQDASGQPRIAPLVLKSLSLEELSQIEVTTPSKQPVKAFQTPSAIYVITGEDIRRSGATSIPEALRLAPGVEVAQIDANKWSIGIRGFGSRLTRSVLVLIDGRTVYTPLFARHLLGGAGHTDGRYRPDRSDPRPRRHHLGAERRQRRDQHHHQGHAIHAGTAAIRQAAETRSKASSISVTAAAMAGTSTIASTAKASRAARDFIPMPEISTIGELPRPAFASTGTGTIATPSRCRAISMRGSRRTGGGRQLHAALFTQS